MPGCNFADCFMTHSADGSFAFSEERFAVESWKLSYSRVPGANLTFHRKANVLHVHMNGNEVGKIESMKYGGLIYDGPQHL
jgi:hypothetical protein